MNKELKDMTKEELIQHADDYDLFLKDLKAETKALAKRNKENKYVVYIGITTTIIAVVFLLLSTIGGQ